MNNIAPTVEAGPDQTVLCGIDTVFFSGSFTDPGFLDTHIITWDFGDGGTASGTLTPTHSYTNAGVFTVTLTVIDDDGGIGSDTLTVIMIIPATVDFDPDTLNLKSKGKFVTVYIELPEGYDVSQIDVSSIMLNDQIKAEAKPTEIGDYDGDGIPDLMVKFNRSAVQVILQLGGKIEITINGNLIDSRIFEGKDTIRVIS